MNKAPALVFGTLICVAAMTAANANTGTDNLGNVKIGTDDSFAFASTRPPASFTDTINFVLGSNGANVVDTFSATGVKGLGVVLYDDTTAADVTSCIASCTFSDLTKGDRYSVIYTGTTLASATDNSSISGTLAVTAAVPEPGSLAMILAGIGFLGVYQWRRRGRSPVQAVSGAALA
jgi:hypothetical protein